MIKKINSMLLHKDEKIMSAINVLNKTGSLIIIVISKSKKIIGTITDGDIRKGLAMNISLDEKLETIMNKNPKFVYKNSKNSEIKKKFEQYKIRACPIVNEQKEVLGCYFWEDFIYKEDKPPFLIMAGGYGKRLGDLTKECPKPMLKVHNTPILEHIINKAKIEGFKNIYISTHYKSEIIENYFNNKNDLEVNITFLKEKHPLGTGGSFKFMKEFKGPIVVTNGDIISKIAYQKLLDFHKFNKGYATMAILKHEITNPFGVVEYDGIELSRFREKPIWTTYINAGIYVLENKASKYIKNNEPISMTQLFDKIKNDNKNVLVFHMHEKWIDVGTPKELKKLRNKNWVSDFEII